MKTCKHHRLEINPAVRTQVRCLDCRSTWSVLSRRPWVQRFMVGKPIPT